MKWECKGCGTFRILFWLVSAFAARYFSLQLPTEACSNNHTATAECQKLDTNSLFDSYMFIHTSRWRQRQKTTHFLSEHQKQITEKVSSFYVVVVFNVISHLQTPPSSSHLLPSHQHFLLSMDKISHLSIAHSMLKERIWIWIEIVNVVCFELLLAPKREMKNLSACICNGSNIEGRKKKKIENDKNVIYAMLLGSICIKVFFSFLSQKPKQTGRKRIRRGRGCFSFNHTIYTSENC